MDGDDPAELGVCVALEQDADGDDFEGRAIRESLVRLVGHRAAGSRVQHIYAEPGMNPAYNLSESPGRWALRHGGRGSCQGRSTVPAPGAAGQRPRREDERRGEHGRPAGREGMAASLPPLIPAVRTETCRNFVGYHPARSQGARESARWRAVAVLCCCTRSKLLSAERSG
jgi:hypothetical protein